MGNFIQFESTFDGTASFTAYGRLENDKKTPFVGYRCTDVESGDIATGKLFCSEKALPYTVKKLRALGIEGVSDRDVLAAAAGMVDADCTFDTIDKEGYFNADNLRARGASAGGGAKQVDQDEFMNVVLGGTAKVETAPAPKSDDCPF